MPFCSSCGSREPEGAAFCSSCGQSMTIPSTTTTSNNMREQSTITQTKNNPTHIVNMSESVSHQEPVSEIEEDLLVTLTRQKAEPHDHDQRRLHGHQRWRWRWRYGYRM